MKTKNYIILLRGVMPTGKNKVPMAQLREKLTEAGLKNVGTYIQSGNVLATSDLKKTEVEALVHDSIKRSFGGELSVIAKTTAEFKNILKKIPFPNTDTSRLYFSMLAAKPDPELLKRFLEIDFSPEKMIMEADVIYTLYATRYSNSKFNNNWYERKLKVAITTRNYNTMNKLLERSQEQEA